MAFYIMADTHLSVGCDKPMDVFGSRWTNYTEKIEKNWRAVIREEDTVVLPGDVSWGMTLAEALPDLRFLDSLPGTKILGKGNHDYWWETARKMQLFFAQNGLSTLQILFNNAYRVGNIIVCGCRGWYADGKQVIARDETDPEKIVAREVGRLRLSIAEGKKIQDAVLAEEGVRCEIVAALHFPPVFTDYYCEPIVGVLKENGIRRCYFGHIHANYGYPPVTKSDGIEFRLISADYLDFHPFPIDEKHVPEVDG